MKRCILIFLLFSYFNLFVKGQSVLPLYYWPFDAKNAGRDIIRGKELNTKQYKCNFNSVRRGVGEAINLGNQNCLITTSALKSNVVDEFSVECFFKGTALTFLTFSQQSLIIRFNYNGFLFRTTTTTAPGKSAIHNFEVALKGTGKDSYSYYIDDNWHHLVFTASLKTGEKKIYVDGECPEGFSTSILKGKQFELGASDGFKDTDQIDELAFYNKALQAELIAQHFVEARNGNSYSFTVNKTIVAAFKKSVRSTPSIDPKEYAPGYPDYTVQATDQLKQFPLPRYNSLVPAKRNMSWMDIGYLHRELPGRGGKGFGKTDPKKAVELIEQMAKYWNYYIDIPVLRTTAEAAQKNYRDKNGLYGSLVDYANRNPQYPVASILIEVQGRPVHAGFESSKAYVTAQDLPAKYYLKNEKGIPVIQDKRKWLSPLMPLDIMEKDGKTSRFYLDQLMKNLRQAPALINENGEVFGHIRPEALLKKDPAVWAHYQRSGLTESQYSGWFQNRIDSVYRSAVMKGLDPLRTHFSFYNISAFNPNYWPDYAMRRGLNRWNKDTVYATPDFYPRTPDNWQNARGAFNGYGTVARGRITEIALGDRYFTPFVSAGWGEEENNIRPAQWLALLKSMVMLGADFFYTGYFNVTGAGGKWSNGAGPNDPRGYAYQIAMPAYAQAIRTWAPEFFSKGELLNPADSGDLMHQFRFKGKAENELILVRKLGRKYLIYGSIQPNSNIMGNVPQSKQTTITLEGKSISFEIRRQGSMYVLDITRPEPIFYQLDGWHQYEHPYYWDKDIVQEAEVYSDHKGDIKIITEKNADGFTFSVYNTYSQLNRGNELTYSFTIPYSQKYTLYIKARSVSGTKQLMTINENRSGKREVNIDSKDWKFYQAGTTVIDVEDIPVITITTMGNGIEVDQFLMKPEN